MPLLFRADRGHNVGEQGDSDDNRKLETPFPVANMAVTIDIPALLNPLPAPAGADNPEDPNSTPPKLRETRAAIEEARRSEDPSNYPESDSRHTNPKKSEWKKVVELAGNCLRDTAKDLRAAARLTEALVHENGFAGARDGLSMMRQLVEKFWDTLYPRIDDGDLDVRAGDFNWLDSFDKGSRLASTLCYLPLVSANGASLAYFNFKPPSNAAAANQAELDKTVGATPLEACEKTAKDIEACRGELEGLLNAVKARWKQFQKEGQAPGFTSLRKAVEDCRQVINQIVERKRPTPAPKPDKAPDQPGAGPAAPTASASPAVQRAEIYRQLSQLSARLRDLEPHSPVPSMIERAVEYGKMAFSDLLKEMVREPKMLADLYREYGVKDPGPAKK
jgi:type VI secretion system protein ImpA